MKKLVACSLYAFLCFTACFCCVAVGSAQVTRGNLAGRITDSSGAIVVGAHVVAREAATGSEYTAESNSAGDYNIPFVTPGTYSLTVTSTGFKSFTRDNVIIAANEHVTGDAALSPGAQTEQVSVTAETTLLETSMASTGQVLDREDIQNIPVNGRTPLILGQLAYGAISTGNPQFNHPFDNSGPSSVALGGGASKKNEILMDGSPDGGSDGTLAYSPPMDAVQEVKVETFQADAAYGHTSGGTINQVTRSGTNRYHGSAYEFNQVSYLADTNWFTKNSGAKKPVTRFNQYGGTLGGPVMIPKLYSGRDRLFWFFAFEGIQDNTPTPSILTVPTTAEKAGDFSALLPLGDIIYDPSTGVKNGSRVQRQPFAGNKITTPLNPVGEKLVSYFPAPNRAPQGADGTGNYYYPGNSTDSFDSEFGRIDANIGSHDKLFGTFRHNYRYHASGNAFNNIATGSVLIQPNWGSTVDEVHVFSDTLVWDNRVNWTRNTESRPLAASFVPSQLGFPTYLDNPSVNQGMPVTVGTKFVDFGYSKGDLIPFDQFQIFSTLNKQLGKHSVALGTDLRLLKQSTLRYGNSSGSYTFGLTSNEGWTNGPFDNSSAAGLGQELASMLLGLPTGGSYDINDRQTSQAKYLAFFAQDNYRVFPSLTLNIGIRYERDLPATERHLESVSGFDINATNPVNAAAQTAFAAHPVAGVTLPTVKGGITFSTAAQPSYYQTKADNVSPRVGFAWTPRPLMSVRGGFGIFNSSLGRVDPIATGFSQTTTLQASLDGYLTPYGTLSNPFPAGLIQPPGNSLGLATNLGQSVSYYPQHLLNDYAERWDIDVQQQMPGNILFEIGYVGEHGVHQGISRNMDYLPASLLSVGQVKNNAITNDLTSNVTNPFAGLLPGSSINGSTVQKQQLLLPYPEFTSVTATNFPSGYSLFDALEARLEKRMSHGIRFLANYSWSKRFEGASYLNPQDPKPEKRIAADDRPQHLVIAATYEFPFGRGQRFAVPSRVLNYAASGWKLSDVYTYQPDGAPLAWGDIIYLGSNLNDLQVNPHAVNGTFDVTKFDRVSADQPVTTTHIRTLPSQVTHARQDGINSMDVSIIKENHITDTVSAALRMDAFNVLNHPSFSAPTLSPTSSSFGKIQSQANLPRAVQLGLEVRF